MLPLYIPSGLEQEGIYRLSGMKSKIEELKMAYDKGMGGFSRCLHVCELFVHTQVHVKSHSYVYGTLYRKNIAVSIV